MPNVFLHDVFVSYHSGDREWVKELVAQLRNRNLVVWLDDDDIRAGERWVDSITRGLMTSRCVAVVVSPESMSSEMVKNEWQIALDAKRVIIPLLYRDAELPIFLRIRQWVDFREPSRYSENLNILVVGIRKASSANVPLRIPKHLRARELPVTTSKLQLLQEHIDRLGEEVKELERRPRTASAVGLVVPLVLAASVPVYDPLWVAIAALASPAVLALLTFAATRKRVEAANKEIDQCRWLRSGLAECNGIDDATPIDDSHYAEAEKHCRELVRDFWNMIRVGANPAAKIDSSSGAVQ